MQADVTVVVVTWQGVALLPACLESLRRQTTPHTVLVVDNGSTDGTEKLLAERFPEVRVLQTGGNLGFAGGVQAGLDAATTRYVALLNNDAVAEPGWLAALVASLDAHPDAAAVTSRMLLQDTDPPLLNNTGVVLLAPTTGRTGTCGPTPPRAPNRTSVFGFSGGAALLRRTRCARSAASRPGSSSTTRTPTCPGGCGWPAGTSATSPAPSCTTRTPPPSTRPPTGSRSSTSATGCSCSPAAPRPAAWSGRWCASCSPPVPWRQAPRCAGRCPTSPVFAPGLRLRVLGPMPGPLPWALVSRRAIRRSAAG